MSVTHLMARAARSVVTVVVFIFALHLFFTAHGQTGNTVTCNVPSLEPLASTSVTCHFPEDVSQTRMAITVSFYRGAQYTGSNEKDILECWWVSGGMNCNVQQGYTFNRMISNELTLEIPRVSTKHIGGYACKLSNIIPNDMKPCELKIKLEGKTMCDVPSVPLNAPTSLTCYFPEDLSKNTADFSVYHKSGRSYSGNVMSCQWTGHYWFCNIIGGYQFDQTVTNHLTLEIPNAQEDQKGSYTCHFTSSTPVRYESCSLTFITGDSVPCAVSLVEPLASTSLKCYFPEDVTQTKRGFSVYWYKDKRVPQNILDSWWRSGKMQCYIRPGYNLTSILPHIATLEIPRATVEQTGTYMCLLDSFNNFKTCKLGFKIVGKTMCDIPSVSRKSPTSLTCYFPEDISKTRTGFNVYHYTSQGDKIDVIDCGWKEDNIICNTARDYEFEHNVSDHVTLNILNPLENHEGTYSCQMKGDEVVRSETCSFMLFRETTSSCYVRSAHEGHPSTLTCTFSSDVNINKRNVQVVHVDDERNKDDQPDCVIAAGYKFNNTITDHLVITIPQASRDHNGLYACHVLGSEPQGFKQCPFIVVKGEDINVPVSTIAITMSVVLILIVNTGVVFVLRKEMKKNAKKQVSFKEISMISAEEKRNSSTPVLSKKELQTREDKEEEFWENWVEAAFPNLDTDFYFLPPVPINLQPFRQTDESNQAATSPVQDNDDQDDAAIQRVLLCLEKMCKSNREVVVGVSQFMFDYYLHESCDGDGAGKLPLPPRHQSDLRQKWKQWDIDVLLIHPQFGLVICMISAFDGKDKTNLQKAIAQLDRAVDMLSDLVSDVAPGVRVTKTIAFPNLTSDHLLSLLLSDSELTELLGQCLIEPYLYDIARLCLCCDQLSEPKTSCDVSKRVLRELKQWWNQCVADWGDDPDMTPEIYKRLVARLCGPATTVSVPCTCPPRVSVKTLGQAVWCTGECYTAVITLFPEQLHLLHTQPPTLFVTGPPGTGKTVVLLLMAIQWLRCGHHVYVVSTWRRSRAACTMLYHLLLQTVNTQQSAGVTPGQPHLLEYNLYGGNDEEKAVNDLSQAASGGSLYVIADEVVSRYRWTGLCEKLLTQVPHLHLWAASYFHQDAPAGWQVEHLTRPLRSPSAILREVEQDWMITRHRDILPYSERGVPDHTDGPPVTRLYHRGQGHSGDWSGDCVTCGREVASFLHSLRVGVTESGTATSTTVTSTSGLQWRDVLVLYCYYATDNLGVVTALEEAGIPVRVMKYDDIKKDDIEDVATARSNVVWVVNGLYISGLERKVVVCLQSSKDEIVYGERLHVMSRCTSHLVIVSHEDEDD